MFTIMHPMIKLLTMHQFLHDNEPMLYEHVANFDFFTSDGFTKFCILEHLQEFQTIGIATHDQQWAEGQMSHEIFGIGWLLPIK